MLKTAVCITGQPRHFEETYSNIYNNIIKPNNADVFLHAWFDEKDSGSTIKNAGVTYYKNKNKNYIVKKDTYDKLKELYKPIDFIIEKQIYFKDIIETNILSFLENNNINYNSTFSMFYSLLKCGELIRNYEQKSNFKYDYIIKIRFDVFLNAPIIVNKFDSKYFNNPYTTSLDDRIWFSNSNNMYNISKTYNYIKLILKDDIINNKITVKNTKYYYEYKNLKYLKNEIILLDILVKFNICMNKFKLDYNLYSRL